MAFDLLHLDGDDLRLRPIEARREVLMRLIAGADGIVCSEALVAEGTVMFAKACEFGREGIVSKRKGNFYKFGKSRHLAEDEDPGFRQDVNRSSSMRPNVCKICEALQSLSAESCHDQFHQEMVARDRSDPLPRPPRGAPGGGQYWLRAGFRRRFVREKVR